jgi:hypothetical protein
VFRTSRAGRPSTGRLATLLVAAAAVLAGAGCDLFAEKVHRGRVIDQNTGEPVAGAIVTGRYFGGVSFGGSSCNRAESTVSDAQGWFELPLDPKAGPLLLEAFKRGYVRGSPTRYAVPRTPAAREWRISVQKWNEANTRADVVAYEPETYASEAAAKRASGEDVDVFVRKAPVDRNAHIKELWGYQKDCTGPPQSSDGLLPFLHEILKDQTELGDSSGIKSTQDWIELARNPRSSQRATPR